METRTQLQAFITFPLTWGSGMSEAAWVLDLLCTHHRESLAHELTPLCISSSNRDVENKAHLIGML